MRLSRLLGVLLAASLASCVSPHTAGHLADTDRVARVRAAARNPGPPAPQRRIEVHDCTRLVGATQGNLYCG